jgi:hypothetical protein
MKTLKIAASIAIALALAGCNQPNPLTNQDRAEQQLTKVLTRTMEIREKENMNWSFALSWVLTHTNGNGYPMSGGEIRPNEGIVIYEFQNETEEFCLIGYVQDDRPMITTCLAFPFDQPDINLFNRPPSHLSD